MASKKQRGMVFCEEGGFTPAADHLPECFAALKPGRRNEGGKHSTCLTNEEAGMMGSPYMNPSEEAIKATVGLPALKYPAGSDSISPGGLSPACVCRGIRVTLDNNSMWNEFFKCRTEMILTKQGSRMFPYCRFRISGLQPSRKYTLIMDIQPLDNSKYEWTGSSWQVAGKAESQVKSAPFAHPESPSTGQHWMLNPVSFYKLKLTNNLTDQEGNTMLHPMHRYLPRLHIFQTDKPVKDIKLSGPAVFTFTFPQTEFMAVTAYQNSHFAQLKVDCNPFAKGLKEDISKLKVNSKKDYSKDGGTTTNKLHPVKKSLKSLLENHKLRTSKAANLMPSVSCDLQTTNRDQSAAKISGESSRSPPAQKLFSELIREAHVSLQRCNMDQLSNNNIHHTTEWTNTKTTTLKHNGQEGSKPVRTHGETSATNKDEAVVSTRKVRQDPVKSLNISTDCPATSASSTPLAAHYLSVDSEHQQDLSVDSERQQNSFVESEHQQNSSVDLAHTLNSSVDQPKPEAPSEDQVKQHKRPAQLPLPALALFLKQHSTKRKKAKIRQDSPPPALPSETSSEPMTLNPASSKDPPKDITQSKKQTSSCADECLSPDEPSTWPSSPSGQEATAASNGQRTDYMSMSDPEITTEHQADSPPVLSSSDELLCPPLTSFSPMSSFSLIPSPSSDLVLPVEISHPSASPTMKTECLLPDPECSSFAFEPLSPTSSPEPLPSLPVSITLELSSQTSEYKCVHPEEESAESVFKWHTVLPPPEPDVHSSFTTFQSTPHTLPLASVPSPVLPSETASLPEPQSLDPSTSPPEMFQVNEQSLPFSAELSPLALQLPLSPTFSSLDGDPLSPTPSLADLVHLFSMDDDLGLGVEFSNSESVAATCLPSSTVEADPQESSQPLQMVQANKPCKRRKKCRRRKVARTHTDQEKDNSTYTCMQANLEEVEEQLFISFTSKEALKLHIVDSLKVSDPEAQRTHEGHLQTPEGHLQTPEDSPEHDSLEKKIAAFQKILLRDLKLMRHRQVIHPVLQEVGLKMNLLDPTQAIDLQYLGVRLPLPPPGLSVDPSNPGVCGAFVSRTGKTTDVTQIKGWREKFSPSEAPPPPALPEVGPGPDTQKKNLSAFCSDMLDQYLENEGKLIDRQVDSLSQQQSDPPVYQLPTTSTSYVRTLDSILKKQVASDLISGFIPPSKRPKLPPKEPRTYLRETTKQRGPKSHKPRPESALTSGSSPAESTHITKLPIVPTAAASLSSAAPPISEPLAPINKPKKQRHIVRVPFASGPPPKVKESRKLKPRTMSQTLIHPSITNVVSEDLAPLDSDPEQGNKTHSVPVMTRGLLRQKDLEDGGVWEGKPRTRITEERAAVALTSLFTLKGFVIENPTTPVQVVRRQAPPCLNEFCRLGCVCCSLSHGCRISHCGRPACMLGCSCLKQKVVLLKHLDPDSSPSHQGNRKRRRRRRMKMAYVLKEADSVSQPAQRVRTLWKRDGRDSDQDPIHIPKAVHRPCPSERTTVSSCARVRGYFLKRRSHKVKDTPEDKKSKDGRLKRVKLKDPQRSTPSAALGPDQVVSSVQSPSSCIELTPKPSKRLIILTEGKWGSAADRSMVLKHLCERMAQDQLNQSFCLGGYRITPISQTAEGDGADSCIQYRVHISIPEPEKPAQQAPNTDQQQEHMKQVFREADPPEEWQREVEAKEAEPPEDWQRALEEEEAEPSEDWQREVEEDEAEPPEDWQREVEEEEEEAEPSKNDQTKDVSEEKAASTYHQVHDANHREEQDIRSEKKKRISLGLPFLTGVSPAGFLMTKRKQPGGTDHLVQVNGKLYPLAKIQLGQMGALHPANRLAAYLTGRVGSNRKQHGSSAEPHQSRSPGTPHHNVSSSSPVVGIPLPKPQPSVPIPSIQTPPTESHLPVFLHQSAALSNPPTPEGTGSRVVTMMLYPNRTGKTNQVTVVPAASSSSAHLPGPNPALKVSQVWMVPATGPLQGPVRGPSPTSTGQRMILKPVQTTSGLQFYRRPDGKLVQLVPLSQLRPVPKIQEKNKIQDQKKIQDQTCSVQKVLQPAYCQTSDPQSLPLLPAPTQPPSAVLAQRETCKFKVFPTDHTKDPMIVTCVKVPLPPPTKMAASSPLLPKASVNLLSLNPDKGEGASLGVKTVTTAPCGVVVHQKPHTIIQTTSRSQSNPPGSEVSLSPPQPPAHRTGPEPEPCSNLRDLDMMCVETEVVAAGTVVGDKQQSETLETEETENSSDFEEETDEERDSVKSQPDNIRHNMLEKQRRVKMMKLFKNLRRELGQDEKTPKIHILKKAKEAIQELRTAQTNLTGIKRLLMKRRDHYLNIIAPPTGSKHKEVIEEAGLLSDKMYELTDNSSDEEKVIALTTNVMDSQVEHDVQSVTMGMMDEIGQLSDAQRSLSSIMEDLDSKDALSAKKLLRDQRVNTAFKALQSVMNDKNSARTHLLKQACREIQTLQCEMKLLKSLKSCLRQQRDAYMKKIQQGSGKSQQGILRKHQVSKKDKAANHLQDTEGGVASSSTDDDIILTSSNLQQPIKAPHTLTPPTPTPVQTHFLKNPPVLAPTVTHNSSGVKDRTRTIPNILTRRRKMVKGEKELPLYQALVPTEALSLAGALLPGQPVLTMTPVMSGPSVLQTSASAGVASVTLSIPGLTNQQIHITSLPQPQTAQNINNQLQLVQPTKQQEQLMTRNTDQQPTTHEQLVIQQQPVTQQQQPVTQQQQPVTQQQQPVSQQLVTQKVVAQQQPVTQPPPVNCQQTPQVSPGESSFRRLGLEDSVGVSIRGGADCLTSLLDEIVFLNQQNSKETEVGVLFPGKQFFEVGLQEESSTVGEVSEQGGASEPGGASEQGSPWLLRLDSDSEDTVTTETAQTETTTGQSQPSPVVLTPPPLLQMKVGGATEADLSSIDGAAVVGEETRRDGDMTWRPMPRLVPLGLRGHASS
ncbi:MAX dimerization protein MGA a isoform X2 [Labrus bergylta]|uniref:MAX dimerization protein MGA a isoform X2 n=1 Tax=Labrus bergylta TaxID=56723 RepID=UPI0033140347